MEYETELRALVKEELEDYMQNQFRDLAKNVTTDLTNENGNSSIKQSGNGFVYVDNTGIAYALSLFFYHFMSEEGKQNIHIDQILAKLDDHIGDNRKMFEATIQSLRDNEE
ncbi:hypothetical protein [Paraliobacillus sediminis]|uniref:hypothetical protein n=1 Tax=Paraliobacillus sediminis TaxID=1885916 RepID=UPI000E3E4C26|nr:hypothetical protein [Paraliobacillus sediminis]